MTGTRARGDLFEAIESQFFPHSPPATVDEADDLVTVVKWFRDEFEVYVKLANGVWPYERLPGEAAKSVRAWQIDRLRRLIVTIRHDLAIPVLLAAARAIDEDDFASLVYMLEIFAFRYKIICNGHATRPGNLYYEQAKQMREATESTPYSLQNFRSGLRQLVDEKAGDTLFKQLLSETLRYSNSSQRVNIKEFLTVLEDHLSWWKRTGSRHGNANPGPSMMKVIDIEEATLEHIYPQNAEVTDRDPALEPLKHSLGNLTFFGSGDNVAAANKSFDTKRAVYYAPSEVGMTSDLALRSKWNVADVADRQDELLKQAVRIFVV